MQLFAFRQKQFLRILLAWLLPIPASLLEWMFHAEVGPSPWLLFLPVIVFAPVIGGFWGGLGATVFSALLAWYFFLPPLFSFGATSPGLLLTVLLFACTGILFSLVYDRLRDRDRKYRLLFQRAGDGIVQISAQGRILDANDQFAAMVGRLRPALIGAQIAEVVVDLSPQHWQKINERLRAGVMLTLDEQLRRDGGQCLPVEVTVTGMDRGEQLAVVRDVSVRRELDAALRRSEDKFAKFFRSSSIALNVSRLDNGQVLEINEAFTTLFGYTPDDVVGRTSTEIGLFSVTERAAAMQILQRDGQLLSYPASVRCKSGETRECRISGVVIELSEGPCLLVNTVDVSAQQHMEDALRASEERLRWAMDATNEGMWDWDILTGEVFGNDQWFRLFGYEPGETPATINLWSSTLHPDDVAVTYQVLEDYLQGRRPDYASEHRVITGSGEVRWHLSVGKVVAWDAEGKPRRMVGTNADITARKLAELQLRHNEERFRLIVENAPVAIAIWGENGALHYVSAAFETSLGLVPAELVEALATLQADAVDLAAVDLTSERLAAMNIDDPAYVRAGLRAVDAVRYCLAHRGEKVWIEETLPHAGGGAIDMQFIYQSFAYNSTGNEVVTVAYDISEHRALERLLRETNSELERQVAARTAQLEETVAELRRANAGKDAFLAAVSHELRTPIMGVLSMSELLESEERGPLNADQTRYARTIAESGQRLLGTVNSILLYTQAMTGAIGIQQENCYLEELCAIAVRSAANKAERKQQRLTCAVNPSDLQIVSDAQHLLNILRVLLDNAIKFTPAGGSIQLTAGLASPALVHIAVADTGIGISEEQAAGLFRPFAQGDSTLARRFEGLGLGLAYAGKMAELLGGSLTVSSVLGQGSCFTLALPVR